jgi:hypothetical protein
MSTPAEIGLARWHPIIEAGDPAGLPAAVAPDAVFHSPALFKPIEGRDGVIVYLTAAIRVFSGDFRYRRTWQDEASAVLEFTTAIGGKEVHGVDLIEWDEAGLIRDFTVMIRPMSALAAVIEHMQAEITRVLQG